MRTSPSRQKAVIPRKARVAKRNRKLELILPLRCLKFFERVKVAVLGTNKATSPQQVSPWCFCPVSFEPRTICYPAVTGRSTPKGQVVGFGSALSAR